ncbi:class I SAM-dependent methyltransferase [Chengkuizengella axinellae]|uniref:Class I SAM-dependent methyltransferase n=1 Tax=Chengkuizengella axinellae TaxID=3064388 RepID=A0ABT9ITG8_9BACL|nr:class I SAM-dependent methyltransferase [Chengkuizengella sp. 2205SS18-9]MDP5272644.1 class I SAM-dependent methyltransferase [Chengkuizengella sp. 2205SS18-9]
MQNWYEKSFSEDYLLVYKHRDLKNAYEEVKNMIGWLQLSKNSSVFDLCCGMGRHSLALSDFGYYVTGMDLSEVLLHEAKKLDKNKKVTWLHGDMRDIPTDQSFDAVVNLFTSFAYFESDDENSKVLTEVNRILNPKGKFIIDFLNSNVVKEQLVPYSERFTEGMKIEEYRSIEEGFVQKRIVIKDGNQERTYLEKVKLYDLPSFENMISLANLQLDSVYGNYDQSTFEENSSPRLILVGHKKA